MNIARNGHKETKKNKSPKIMHRRSRNSLPNQSPPHSEDAPYRPPAFAPILSKPEVPSFSVPEASFVSDGVSAPRSDAGGSVFHAQVLRDSSNPRFVGGDDDAVVKMLNGAAIDGWTGVGNVARRSSTGDANRKWEAANASKTPPRIFQPTSQHSPRHPQPSSSNVFSQSDPSMPQPSPRPTIRPHQRFSPHSQALPQPQQPLPYPQPHHPSSHQILPQTISTRKAEERVLISSNDSSDANPRSNHLVFSSTPSSLSSSSSNASSKEKSREDPSVPSSVISPAAAQSQSQPPPQPSLFSSSKTPTIFSSNSISRHNVSSSPSHPVLNGSVVNEMDPRSFRSSKPSSPFSRSAAPSVQTVSINGHAASTPISTFGAVQLDSSPCNGSSTRDEATQVENAPKLEASRPTSFGLNDVHPVVMETLRMHEANIHLLQQQVMFLMQQQQQQQSKCCCYRRNSGCSRDMDVPTVAKTGSRDRDFDETGMRRKNDTSPSSPVEVFPVPSAMSRIPSRPASQMSNPGSPSQGSTRSNNSVGGSQRSTASNPLNVVSTPSGECQQPLHAASASHILPALPGDGGTVAASADAVISPSQSAPTAIEDSRRKEAPLSPPSRSSLPPETTTSTTATPRDSDSTHGDFSQLSSPKFGESASVFEGESPGDAGRRVGNAESGKETGWRVLKEQSRSGKRGEAEGEKIGTRSSFGGVNENVLRRESGAAEAQAIKPDSFPEDSSVTMKSAFLPKINYVTLMLGDADVNSSVEVDSLALKYLKDEELTELAGLSPRDSKNSGGNRRSACKKNNNNDDDDLANKNVNNFSFATKKYLEKYGLLGEKSVSFYVRGDEDDDDDDDNDSDRRRDSNSSLSESNKVLNLARIQNQPKLT